MCGPEANQHLHHKDCAKVHMGLIPAFLWLETWTLYPVTQQNSTSMEEISSKKYSNFMDYIVISFSLNIIGQNCSVIFISWFGFFICCFLYLKVHLSKKPVTLLHLLNECYQSAVTTCGFCNLKMWKGWRRFRKDYEK